MKVVTACSALVLSYGLANAGGFDRAVETALPRVVKLYGLGAGIQAGYGTGVVVSEEGMVITVLSLLIDAQTIRAVGHDGTRFEAEVRYRDADRQLTLLQLRRPGDPTSLPLVMGEKEGSVSESSVGPLPFFNLTTEPSLTAGDWVLAAGNSFKVATGSEPVSVAHGVFSARTQLDARRRVRDFPYRGEVLVIDAITSNPGAPGSALVNLEGDFLGVIGRVVVSNLTHTHLNYALPREVLLDFYMEAVHSIEQGRTKPLRDEPAANQIDLGIRIAKTGYRTVLPFVERVQRNSPAMRAGLRQDDLILSINGRPVADLDEFEMRFATLRPGEPVDLVVRRGRAIREIRIEPEG